MTDSASKRSILEPESDALCESWIDEVKPDFFEYHFCIENIDFEIFKDAVV